MKIENKFKLYMIKMSKNSNFLKKKLLNTQMKFQEKKIN